MARPKTEAAEFASMMVRLPRPLLEEFKAKATKKHRSLNKQFLCVIEDWLEAQKEKDAHGLVGSRSD